MRRPTGQVRFLLHTLSFSSVHFTLLLYEVPSPCGSFPSQSVFFIYFYNQCFSLPSFLIWMFFTFLFLFFFLTLFSAFILSYLLVYTFFYFRCHMCFSLHILFSIYWFFHSLFSDSFYLCVPFSQNSAQTDIDLSNLLVTWTISE